MMKRFVWIAIACVLVAAVAAYLATSGQHARQTVAAEAGAPGDEKAEQHKAAPVGAEDKQDAPVGAALQPLAPGIPAQKDLDKLPEPVQATLEALVETARAGDIDAMQRVLDMNELPPIVSRGEKEGAIAYWRRISADGSGRDVLAALLETLEAGYVVKKDGGQEMYLWPYFADAQLAELSPAQQVDLYRLLTPEEVKAMKASGGYSGWSVGIGGDGTWHYFLKRK